MRIGYVGLGNMGGALARRLQLSFPLVVYDLDPRTVEALAESGAVAAEGLPQLASDCDVVFVCLPTSDHVRRAVLGPGGLSAGLRPGALIVDQTTGDPKQTREIAALLEERGVTLIDAPVSGGAAGAEAGTIAIMVGADAAAFERAEPLLKAISPNIHHAGGVGAGQVIKLVNNLMSAAQRMVTFEGVALAAKNGIDPAVACAILQSGGARSGFLETFMGPKIVKGDLFSGFTLGLMHKDVRLACDLGASSGVPMMMGAQTREYLQICLGRMGPDAQVHSAAVVVDDLAGTRVVPREGVSPPR